MRRNAIVTVALAIALLALGSQVAIPAYVSSRLEDKLTSAGGTAHVSVHAFPAASLVDGKGGRLEVKASGLRLDLTRQTDGALARLDDFDAVHADLRGVRSAPFAVTRLQLDRDRRGQAYRVVLDAVAVPTELTQFADARAPGLIGDIAGRLWDDVVPYQTAPTRIRLQATVRSERGNARVVAVSGGVSGLDAGPVAAALASALAHRL